MPDYGHPLTFGTFLSPISSPAHNAVQGAQLSERLGYDLVTFQDHPYQPSFHDTLALLGWVAAQTSTIHVAANVFNLPLRGQPAVLARAAASLDLLSGGRFEMGLGAGHFWDAIEATGGHHLTPGQGVDALSEAVDIIRGMWDDTDRTPLSVAGQHYSVTRLGRGPAPARPIPIWIGAMKPRMLRLVATKADGWLPSLSNFAPGQLAAGNESIDAAATDVGRDPREIRRLLNISELPAGQLVDLALGDGIDTFILASDDPRTLERFAQDTIPAVRTQVDAERV
jgi:alkanesulfonate monooxygenase SsuD/methylene tetrahydromethanopterin reductase-like flavin-dependent oxidoreductase (luciferase family)